MLDRSLIQDSKGNYIFIIDSYTSPEPFSCAISDNSIPIKTSENNPSPSTPSSSSSSPSSSSGKEVQYYYSRNKKLSGGLSAGAIVGIVIACVVALAAVIIIIVLMKKGILSRKTIYKIEQQSSSYNVGIDNEN